MIILLCGLMGSGKTYEAVNFHIVPALKAGRKVKTNIPLNVDYIVAVHGESVRELIEILDPKEDENGNVVDIPFSHVDDLKDIWRQEKTNVGALFVIDEAQIPMPARQTDFNRFALEYATMQRHRGHDWILITQDPSLIYQPLVKLATVTHHFQKNTNVGDMKRYRHDVYDGYNLGRDFIVKKDVKKYDPKLFKYYKSHTESDGEVIEQNITGAFFNIKKLFMMLGLGVLVVFSLITYYFKSFIPSRYNSGHLDQEAVLNVNSDVPVTLYGEDEIVVKTVVPAYTSVPKIIRINAEESNRSTESIAIQDIDRNVYVREKVISIDQFKVAPYVGFKFHIIGNITFHKSASDVFYGVWSDQGVQEQIGRLELVKMGYSITVLNKCTHLFDHQYIKRPFYVTCHAPLFEEDSDKKKNEKKDPNRTMTAEVAEKIAKGVGNDE